MVLKLLYMIPVCAKSSISLEHALRSTNASDSKAILSCVDTFFYSPASR